MRLLIDTHFLLWIVVDPDVIRPREHRLIAQSEILISPVSIWELRLKWQARHRDGRCKGALDPDVALAFIAAAPMELTTLSGADCAVQLETPLRYGDPFDEQLMIHAQRLNAKLLTRDRELLDHPLAYRFR